VAVFGDLVREFRRRAGWTQEELAERSGLSTHAISVLETGRRQPRLSSVTLLTKALGLDEAERDRLLAAIQDQGREADPKSGGRGATPDRVVPRLLPYAVPDFTGRGPELTRLLELAGGVSQKPGAAVVISAIDGMAGVGKTTLAVKVGHTLADRFPDGQIFLDLHGFTPGQQPLEPADALARLLRAVGVDDGRLPERLDERTDLWLSEAARRRLLIVLDNALDPEQVRPLIPGHPGSLVLITSRRRLPSLAGAVSLSLDVLAQDEAVALFTEIVGPRRVDGHAAEVDEIIALCGRLPLAVRIAAARLAHRSTWTPAHLLTRLRDQHQRLAELSAEESAEDHGVAAAFSVSYEALDPDQRRAFRSAGLHPGEDFSAHAVGALCGLPADRAEELLEDLLDHHLLIEQAPGRYVFHDLLRQHALRMAEAQESEPERRAAVNELLDHYRYTAFEAAMTVYPHDHRRLPVVAAPRSEAAVVDTEPRALAWLQAERANLIACARCPEAAELPGLVRDLSAILFRYLDNRGWYADSVTLHTTALETTRAQHDRAGQVIALLGLGGAHWRFGQYERVLDHYLEGFKLARELGDAAGEARCLGNLGMTYLRLGRYEEAVDFSRQALDVAERTSDRPGLSHALTVMALSFDRLGRYAEALDCNRRSLANALQTGVKIEQSRALLNLGTTETRLGLYHEALDHIAQAAVLAEEIGDPSVLGITLTNTGVVYRRLGRYEEALDHSRRGIELFRSVDDRIWEARGTHLLSRVHTAMGNHELGAEGQRWALKVAEEFGDDSLEAESLNGLGADVRAVGDPGEALELHRRALELSVEQHDLLVQGHAHAGLGDALHDLGRAEEATAAWRAALTLYRRLGVPEAGLVEPKLRAADPGFSA
jgi:tetratricopeptide (TPR) repeat protein/transcriptional regulator with XRE-family HTH domain